MPNYVKNRLHMSGTDEEVKAVIEAVREDGKELGTFDFNKLIPMPESLNVTAGSIEKDTAEAFLTALNPDMPAYGIEKMHRENFQGLLMRMNQQLMFGKYNCSKSDEEMLTMAKHYGDGSVRSLLSVGRQYVENFLKYGCTTWYDFCPRAWGSKWNALRAELADDRTFEFDTAWSRVMPIISKLAERFPNVDFEYSWADEDIGNNVGECEFKGGELVMENVMNSGSKEAYELSAELWGMDLAEFGFEYDEKSGTYSFNDEQYEDITM